MSLALVLPDLGDPGAGWRAAVPSRDWEVLDQPGHGAAPPPRSGSYDPVAVLTLARWRVAEHGVAGSLVVGVGENAVAATLLAGGRGCAAVVLVDGLGGPWADATERVEAGAARVRCLLADPAALAPPPTGVLDPKTAHGYGLTVTPRLARPLWGAVTVPALVVETPASATPPGEVAERASWFGGPTTVVGVPDDDPRTVVEVVAEWWARSAG
jgi:pimeloyl-ACP methyl ester carboxylesterase